MNELYYKLNEAEKQNETLKKEVKALNAIKNDQAKALEKVLSEQQFPTKIKILMDDLRVARVREQNLVEKLKAEERTSNQ